MNVLAVIDTLGHCGGAERLIATLLPELRKFGVQGDLAVLQPPYEISEDIESQGIKVFRLRIRHRRLLPQSVYRLNRLYSSKPYDVVWGHLYFGNLNAALLKLIHPRIRSILTLHSMGYRSAPPRGVPHYLSMRAIQSLGLNAADKIVAVSQAIADEYQDTLGWKNIAVIHNCIPVASLPPEMGLEERDLVRAALELSNKEFLIAVPSRFVWQKGHSIFFEAIHLLAQEKNWRPHCVLVGDGPLEAVIRRQVRGLGLSGQTKFVPPIGQAKLFPLLQACDAVVLPSLHEPFGIAAAETMAMGIPTIVSAVEGLKELAGEGGAAMLVKPGDPRGLADAIWHLSRDKDLRSSLSEIGRRRVRENFDAPVAASKWADLFMSLA